MRLLAGRFKAAGLRLDAGEGGDGEVDHFMTALVQLFSCWLACACLVEREKEHAALGAEALFVAGRVPARGKAFWREHDEFSARLGDCVAASLFERAHEGRDSRAARSDSRCSGNGCFPLRRALRGRAVAFDRHEHRKRKECVISVCEPFAAKEADAANGPEKLCVVASKCGPLRVFANVAAKGGELTITLDDPIVPRRGEYERWRGRATAQHPGGCDTRVRVGLWRLSGYAGRRVRGDYLPIGSAKGFGELADYHAKGHAIWRGLYLHHQVNVIGHYHEGRYRLYATPFEVEAFDNAFEGSRDVAFDKAAIVADSREIGEAVKPLERHHVEERRLVVEIEEASHIAYSIILSRLRKRRTRR